MGDELRVLDVKGIGFLNGNGKIKVLYLPFVSLNVFFSCLNFPQGGSMTTSNGRRKWCGQRINEGQLDFVFNVVDAVDVCNVFGVVR